MHNAKYPTTVPGSAAYIISKIMYQLFECLYVCLCMFQRQTTAYNDDRLFHFNDQTVLVLVYENVFIISNFDMKIATANFFFF